jgi:hypothetical protein
MTTLDWTMIGFLVVVVLGSAIGVYKAVKDD